MTVASPMAFPGGRVLAGWWRQLTQESPGPVRALWFAHLFLHRVEALFEVCSTIPLDPLSRLVLQALTLTSTGERCHPAGGSQCHRPGRGAATRQRRSPPSARCSQWSGTGAVWLSWGLVVDGTGPTSLGTGSPHPDRAAASGSALCRRPFRSRPTDAALFLKINPTTSVPWTAGEDWRFDPVLIERCLEQSEEWKKQHGFPPELRKLLGPQRSDEAVDQWQRVILDRPEHLASLLVLVGEEVPRLLGYPVRPEGWVLQSGALAFAMTTDWQSVFPELTAEPPLEVWQQAWRSWCQPRSVPVAEMEACSLRPQGAVLRVQAPAKLVERLKAARSDAVKGEAWLLAGAGQIRPAALVELADA